MGDETIAIIGGGCSGTLLAIQLLRWRLPNARIVVIERSGTFARGIAYADGGAAHLLNVGAANMSAFPDDPDHFARWLEGAAAPAEILHTEAGAFATRRLYGRYLHEMLQAAQSTHGPALTLVHDEVEGIVRADDGRWQIACASGACIAARAVVLALGNVPAGPDGDAVVHLRPWSAAVLDGLAPDRPVLLVGTGLTMADIVLALQARGFSAPMFALSRRGLLPQAHAPVPAPWPTPRFAAAERASAIAIWRAVRKQIAAAEVQGIGWRAVIDSLRPISAGLWQGLPAAEQSRLLRHARPYWDVARHRMAGPAATRLHRLIASGGLRLIRGRVRHIERTADGASVEIRRAVSGALETLAVQRVIYATGLPGQSRGTGLLAHLHAQGVLQFDAHGFGPRTSAEFAVVDGTGDAQPDLWALGPLVRGTFWECIAVPDIRVQAEALAGVIARTWPAPPPRPAAAAASSTSPCRDPPGRRENLS